MRPLRSKPSILLSFLFFLLSPLIGGASFGQDVKHAQAVFRQADWCLAKERPFKHFECQRKTRTLGYCFTSHDLITEAKGFSGDIGFFLCIDRDGRIREVNVLYHSETPGCGDKIAKRSFLDQFRGKSIYDDFLVGRDIDGITGATISAKSFSSLVKNTSIIAFQALTKKKDESLVSKKARLTIDELIVFLLVILSVGFVLRRTTLLRNFFLIAGIVYLGFYKNLFISVFNLKQIAQYQLPPFSQSISWYILLVLSIGTVPLLGRLYCGWLCPFGSLQEILAKLPFKKVHFSFKVHRRLLGVKYWLLALGVLVSIFLGSQVIFKFEPFIYLFNLHLGLFFYYSLGILLLSLVIPRFFCRYLCFVGAFFGILSKISLLKYKFTCLDPECKICQDRCPVEVIDSGNHIIDHECLRCNRCQRCRLKKAER